MKENLSCSKLAQHLFSVLLYKETVEMQLEIICENKIPTTSQKDLTANSTDEPNCQVTEVDTNSNLLLHFIIHPP